MAMNPYKAEAMGMPYDQYTTMVRLSDDSGYVDPYRAEDHGVEYRWWSAWERDRS